MNDVVQAEYSPPSFWKFLCGVENVFHQQKDLPISDVLGHQAATHSFETLMFSIDSVKHLSNVQTASDCSNAWIRQGLNSGRLCMRAYNFCLLSMDCLNYQGKVEVR